ncbi:NADH-quinone oxidoreductase subunit L [Actinomadura flavalba]|uniref:NADH-quinone oxidoreductase subunit 5 family protein n=1 Tax=Actinomadura flavalba TaxID=1120938 RepID=UPI000365107E|nr:proton-conducting transporter membrane subunit [Actinomadura flavalba]
MTVLVALPAIVGAVLLLVGRRADRAAPTIALAASAGTLGLAVVAAVTRPSLTFPLFEGLPGGLAVDGLSAVLVVTVAAVTLAVLGFAAGDMPASSRFFGLMLLFAAAMLVTVTATDLAVLLVGWEIMGALSYALIGYRWRDAGGVRAATTAFLTTRAGDLGLYFAAGCALAGTGSFALDGLAAAPAPWRDLVAGGIVLAALGKSAQLPFSFWLSRAMAGPSAVSALLHSATMVAAGAYLVLRVQPLLAATGWAATLVAWAGALTALLLGFVALAQRDLKQLLAASTCAQLGFMVLAAGTAAVAGGVAHLAAHAAVKSLLFLGAGTWLTVLGTRDLAALRGAARRLPLVGVTFGVGALALAGVPPLSLWLTKDVILGATGSWPLAGVTLAATVLAAAYSAKALIAVWRGEARPGSASRSGRGGGIGPGVPFVALAAGAAGLGVVVVPPLNEVWARTVGAPAARPHVVELVGTGVLAVVVLGVGVLVARRPPKVRFAAFAVDWLFLERAVERGIVRPVLALARGLAWFDDHVVQRAVVGAAAFSRGAASGALAVEKPVDAAVQGLGEGARRLGALARYPQTGKVHTYFAQAVVGFLVLAVVLVLVR